MLKKKKKHDEKNMIKKKIKPACGYFLDFKFVITFSLKLFYLIKKLFLNIQILFKIIIFWLNYLYSMSKINFYKLDICLASNFIRQTFLFAVIQLFSASYLQKIIILVKI